MSTPPKSPTASQSVLPLEKYNIPRKERTQVIVMTALIVLAGLAIGGYGFATGNIPVQIAGGGVVLTGLILGGVVYFLRLRAHLNREHQKFVDSRQPLENPLPSDSGAEYFSAHKVRKINPYDPKFLNAQLQLGQCTYVPINHKMGNIVVKNGERSFFTKHEGALYAERMKAEPKPVQTYLGYKEYCVVQINDDEKMYIIWGEDKIYYEVLPLHARYETGDKLGYTFISEIESVLFECDKEGHIERVGLISRKEEDS